MLGIALMIGTSFTSEYDTTNERPRCMMCG
jgi:hypothetical protein